MLVGAALVLLLVWRIRSEEELLARELDGYEAYRQKVHARLVPRVW
jgi:protein-S-isoprenylcysteine O-methyltransferase Ste14